MSTALAIAGVTAVLRDLLNDGLINHNTSGVLGSTVSVSVQPPDRVLSGNGAEASQLNLFLYQVTPNTGWSNERLPTIDGSGRTRLANPLLALDLHFLLSAYGNSDYHREILLGYAMQILHDNPVVSRQSVRTALDPSPGVGTDLPAALRALADCGLADQVEQLRITHERLNTEEVSKLWTAFQSHYRPTAAYMVTVVLIESTHPAHSPLPVLERKLFAEPSLTPPVPMIDKVVPAANQPVAQLGETIDLEGHHLDGSDHEVWLSNARFNILERLVPALVEPARLQFEIPAARAADFPVGVYEVSARLKRPSEMTTVETNRLAFVLAPKTTNLPLSTALDGSGKATFSVNFLPDLRSGQSVSLFLGTREIAPDAFTPPAGSLSFTVDNVEKGKYVTRLRIDGIDSPIIDREATPPKFLNQEIEIT
jgi:hypothetical protein